MSYSYVFVLITPPEKFDDWKQCFQWKANSFKSNRKLVCKLRVVEV